MCGIFAYLWDKEATPYLLNWLRSLEYRWYDSAWVCVINNEKNIYLKKATWRVSNLASKIQGENKNLNNFNTWIAHTRWATHWKVTENNTHPHFSNNDRFYVVHNWIIENYIDLKKELEKKYDFYSDTDTEVVAKLFEDLFEKDLVTTLKKVLNKIEWAYAIAVMDKENPFEIVWAKLWSPLVVGIWIWELFISSDSNALKWITKEFISLEDNEYVVINNTGYHIYSGEEKLNKKSEEIEHNEDDDKLWNFTHYMEKEIYQMPEVYGNAISWKVNFEEHTIWSNTLEKLWNLDFEKIEIIASGTSYYSAWVGAGYFEELSGIPTTIHVSTEFKYKRHFIDDKTLYIFISQSWETADTRDCLKIVKERWGHTFGLVNVVGSTIARLTDMWLYTHCWTEIWVASTKAFTWNLAVLLLMALHLWNKRDLDYNKYREILSEMESLQDKMTKVLANANKIKALAEKYSKYKNMFYLWRNLLFPIALEGSLKLKEITYHHSEAYPSGELKHWPLSLVDENFPVVSINPTWKFYEKNISTMKEVKARDWIVIWVVSENDENKNLYDDVIEIPNTSLELTPFTISIALDLFAYFTANHLWREIDKPRNLAKSVTVE